MFRFSVLNATGEIQEDEWSINRKVTHQWQSKQNLPRWDNENIFLKKKQTWEHVSVKKQNKRSNMVIEETKTFLRSQEKDKLWLIGAKLCHEQPIVPQLFRRKHLISYLEDLNSIPKYCIDIFRANLTIWSPTTKWEKSKQ